MVSKLLLAVQENCLLAVNSNEDKVIIGKLLDHYYEINAGIGVHKSPELYGAFPTDAYSHTPATKGAQQPGMTGQVKEDILSRIGELGVFVENGKIFFKPSLLKKSEFLENPKSFDYINLKNEKHTLSIDKNQLSFTYCQVPVVYQLANKEMIQVVYNDQSTTVFESLLLDAETSSKIFNRTNEIHHLKVSLVK